MKFANSVLDLVGDTPLVKLNVVTEGIEATVLAKVEYLNPGGSSKDRIATRIVDAAERDGLLRPGGTIVEPTSGNTGVGLALVAQQRGYRCVFVVPDKVGEDKRNVLRAYGAEVVVTPTAVAPDSPESYYGVSDRLAREIPGAFKPDQYSNPNGPRSHYETTGPEIWRDTDGKVTHFVAGVGTGGTISGVGRYLKEVSGGAVQVVGADPEGSIYSGGTGRPYLLEGVGEDFWPAAYDGSVVDRVVAALRAARDLPADAVVVVLLPDGGRGYLGKIFNDKWMRSYGFLDEDAGATVGDVVAAKGGAIPALLHAHPIDTVRDAIAVMSEFGVSQLPVLTAEPPVVMGEVIGAVSERSLLESVFSGETKMSDTVSTVVSEPLPIIGSGESIAAVRAALASSDALLVTLDGKPHAVITRHDLLAFLGE